MCFRGAPVALVDCPEASAFGARYLALLRGCARVMPITPWCLAPGLRCVVKMRTPSLCLLSLQNVAVPKNSKYNSMVSSPVVQTLPEFLRDGPQFPRQSKDPGTKGESKGRFN